jgi:hypothetical protein
LRVRFNAEKNNHDLSNLTELFHGAHPEWTLPP